MNAHDTPPVECGIAAGTFYVGTTLMGIAPPDSPCSYTSPDVYFLAETAAGTVIK